ncbi:MAG: ATP-binding cassette domain-containing protein, partial [Deinococcota bacterium]
MTDQVAQTSHLQQTPQPAGASATDQWRASNVEARSADKVILEIRDITKTFPGVKALDNVNVKVQEGEIHALVGENGAGKST